MSKFHIIGSGACGFLRLHHILKDNIAIKFKCGRIKYQNSFESWNDNGLIWDAETLSKEERLRRVSLQDTTTNITHSYLKYVPEFIELHPDIKFLCFKGEKNHSIKSLLTSWGYNNPCYVKDRELGKGHNRYAVKQFPNFSDCDNELEATKKYWNTYYTIANEYQEKYPNNFIIVDAPKFFSDVEYSTNVLSNVIVGILAPHFMVDWVIIYFKLVRYYLFVKSIIYQNLFLESGIYGMVVNYFHNHIIVIDY